MTTHESIIAALVTALESVDAGKVYGYAPWCATEADFTSAFALDSRIQGGIATRTTIAHSGTPSSGGVLHVTAKRVTYELLIFYGLDNRNPGGAESIIQARLDALVPALTSTAIQTDFRNAGAKLQSVGDIKPGIITVWDVASVYGARIELEFELQPVRS